VDVRTWNLHGGTRTLEASVGGVPQRIQSKRFFLHSTPPRQRIFTVYEDEVIKLNYKVIEEKSTRDSY
jgi:hypothetical protein